MAKYRTATGLELDESDANDADILARQRAAARESGRSGGDRARTARGRTDLESAYDAGVVETSAPEVPPAVPAAAGGRAARPATARKGAGAKGGGRGGKGGGSIPGPRLIPPRSTKAKDWGGFAFGLVVHALVMSYIRYGKEGPKGWLRAKFLNRPIQGEDLERENRGGSRHENPDSVPWEDLTPEERDNII